MEWDQIVQVALNSGMSVMITVYFLYRDWKFQETLVKLLGSLENSIDRLNQILPGGDTE